MSTPMMDFEDRPPPIRPPLMTTAPAKAKPSNRRYLLARHRQKFYIVMAVLFLAVSWGTTVQWTIEIQEVLFGARSAAGFFIGFIVAALLTAGQAFTSEDNLPAYGAFLVIDCAFTWTQLRGPVDRVMASYKPDDAVALYVAYALLVGFSYLSASLPEQTVFGRRNVSFYASLLRGGRK